MKTEDTRAETVGERVRSLRVARGLTQDDLARRAGFTNTYISKIERGAAALPASTVMRLGNALQVSEKRLLGADGDASPVKQVEVSARRQRILDAAVELFSARGYRGVSIRELAARAGCSTSNLYHHFSSKYEIFVTLIEGAMDRHLQGLNDAIEHHDDPAAQLRHVLRNHLMVHMMQPEVRLLTDDFHPISGTELDIFIDERDHYERGIRGIVSTGITQGIFSVRDVPIAVRAALGACNYVDRWFRPDGPLSADEVADRMADFLLTGFGVSPQWGAGTDDPKRRRKR